MQSFTKKISGRKGKDSAEIFPSSEYRLQLKCDPVLNVKLSQGMQILLHITESVFQPVAA